MIQDANKHIKRKGNRQNYISRNNSTKASPPVAAANVEINIETAKQNLIKLSDVYVNKNDWSDTRGFLTDLRLALGIPDARGASKYGVVNGRDFISSISLTNHNGNAQTYINSNSNYPYNLKIMISRRNKKDTFKAHPNVNFKEFDYFGQKMAKCTNGNPYILIIEGLIDFLTNGVYNDKTGIAISHTSPQVNRENIQSDSISLSESDLRWMVVESVRKILAQRRMID